MHHHPASVLVSDIRVMDLVRRCLLKVGSFFSFPFSFANDFIYRVPGKGGLQLTGKLREVIRESVQIGLSWVKSRAYDLGITSSEHDQFLTDRDIHIHMPEGGIWKEGPSAGTAIVCFCVVVCQDENQSRYQYVFLSFCFNFNLAMTGEISLVG